MATGTILLIEDNEDIRTNTAEILVLANYRVLVAEDGNVGMQLAREHKPDLIICDVMMPELDGYGVRKLLQKDEVLALIPFMFMTAIAEKISDDYITKPFNAVSLLQAIERRLAKLK